MPNPFEQFAEPKQENPFERYAQPQPEPLNPNKTDAVTGAESESDIRAGEILEDLNSGNINGFQAALRATATGSEHLLGQALDMVPEEIRRRAGEAAKSVFMAAVDLGSGTPTGKIVGSGVEAGTDMYRQFEEDNPQLAKDLDAALTLVEIGSIAIPARVLAEGNRQMARMVSNPANKSGNLAPYRVTEIGRAVKDKPAIQLIANGVEPGAIRELQLVARQNKLLPYRGSTIPNKEVPKTVGGLPAISNGQPPNPPKPPVAPKSGSGSGSTRGKLLRMIGVRRKALEEPTFARSHRSTDVIGESVMDRFRYVRGQNRKAAGEVARESKKLKNKPARMGDVVDDFFTDLQEMGITVERVLDKDGLPVLDKKGRPKIKIDFEESKIQGLGKSTRPTKLVIQRLYKIALDKGENATAGDFHDLKQYIDNVVSYGKDVRGLTGATEQMLKRFRSNINKRLSTDYPSYGEANKYYSETIDALDSFQNASGTKIDLSSPYADQAVGTLMRGLSSNNRGRGALQEALDKVSAMAEKHGGEFNDDINVMITLADELEKTIGSEATTSFLGQLNSNSAVHNAGSAISAITMNDPAAAARAAASVIGKGKKPVPVRNKETLDLLEKVIKGEK